MKLTRRTESKEKRSRNLSLECLPKVLGDRTSCKRTDGGSVRAHEGDSGFHTGIEIEYLSVGNAAAPCRAVLERVGANQDEKRKGLVVCQCLDHERRTQAVPHQQRLSII